MNDQVHQPFNAENLLGATVDEANSTELLQVPENEYIAVSQPVTAQSFKEFDIRKGDRAGTKGLRLDLMWDINDESGALKEFLGRAPSVKQGIMLDRNSSGGLEMGKGKNVNLGRVREALGQNLTGKPWSFTMLGGCVARIKVKHRMDDTGRTFAEVSEVAPVG